MDSGSSEVFVDVDVCGVKMHLRVLDTLTSAVSPAASPVVLIHGTAGSADGWDEVLRAFAPERRAIAVDLPGHGGSIIDDVSSTSVATLATCLARVLDDRGVASATWIGNSIGGQIALHAATSGEPTLRGLVLVNATGAHERSELDAFLRDPRSFRARAGVPKDTSLFQAALPLMFSNASSEGARRFIQRSLQAAGEAHAARRTHAAIQAIIAARDSSLRDRLDAVRVPTLVVWGEDDRLLHPDNAHRLATIRGASLVHIPKSGHMPQIETPQELVRAILPFVRRLDYA